MRFRRFRGSRQTRARSTVVSFSRSSLSRHGVLFLKAADNVPAAINTYARVNTSRLSPRVKQLEGLPVSLFFHVSSRSCIASSSTYTHIYSSSVSYFPSLPRLRPLLLFHLFFFFFFFFLREFVACFFLFARKRRAMALLEGRERAAEEYRPGRHFSRRNAESLRSREALRSKRSRCSYRFRGADSFSRVQLVSRDLCPLREREREREGFEIEHREQRELSRADSWLRADEIRFERRQLVEPDACACLFVHLL